MSLPAITAQQPKKVLPRTKIKKAPRRRWGAGWIILALLALLSSLFLTAPAFRWIHYRSTHIVSREGRVKGTVTWLGSRLDGRIKAIEVEAGQRVQKGDIIALLDDAHLRARVAQARAEVLRAQRELEFEQMAIEEDRRQRTLQLSRAELDFEAVDAELQAAKAELNKMEADYQRAVQLITENIASKKELDDIVGNRDVSRAEVAVAMKRRLAADVARQAAKAELDGLRARKAGLKVSEARVETARSHLEAAEADLEASLIRAPEDGLVVCRVAEPGASIKVGDSIVSLWMGEKVWVEAWVEEKHLSNLRIGSHVDVTLEAYPGEVLQGSIERLGVLSNTEMIPEMVPENLGQLAQDTTWINLRIALEDGHPDLIPGISAVIGISK